jgi:uncharacterized protein
MFIALEELEDHRVDFREEIQPGVFDLGADVRQSEPLATSGHAELLEEHRGGRGQTIEDIRVVGDLNTVIEVACARCLDPVQHTISHHFDLLYRPQGADAGVDERAVPDAEAEVSYYVGDGLLLEDVLREQLLLAVPIKLVCRDECKGLCPVCGKNRNLEACSCRVELSDPRWDALKDIRGKLHE